MKLGYKNCQALIVYRGAAEVVRIRKDKGPSYTVFAAGNVFNMTEYEDNLDVHIEGNGDVREVVHVVATADVAAGLPHLETLVVPDSNELAEVISSIMAEINSARLSSQIKDYLSALLEKQHRVAIAFPFMAEAGNGPDALRMAVRKMASFEADLFAGMAAKVGETLAMATEGREAAPAPTSDFAQRVQKAVRNEVPEKHAAEQVPALDNDPEAIQQECKDSLKRLLAEPFQRIGEIDRRLLDAGSVPAWRDAMNEVFDAAMQTSRTLDYAPDDAPRGPRR